MDASSTFTCITNSSEILNFTKKYVEKNGLTSLFTDEYFSEVKKNYPNDTIMHIIDELRNSITPSIPHDFSTITPFLLDGSCKTKLINFMSEYVKENGENSIEEVNYSKFISQFLCRVLTNEEAQKYLENDVENKKHILKYLDIFKMKMELDKKEKESTTQKKDNDEKREREKEMEIKLQESFHGLIGSIFDHLGEDRYNYLKQKGNVYFIKLLVNSVEKYPLK